MAIEFGDYRHNNNYNFDNVAVGDTFMLIGQEDDVFMKIQISDNTQHAVNLVTGQVKEFDDDTFAIEVDTSIKFYNHE